MNNDKEIGEKEGIVLVNGTIWELIEKMKSNFKDLYIKVLDAPKWGYPILLGSWIVWFVLWVTVLIWIPGVTIIFLYWGLKVVYYIENKSLKQINSIINKTKEILNIKIS